ncbi:retrotrans_gag domain-containing protein [Trichonephila clavipes]|nr:retrotrans_gag domain-containing protein [Trichonephila clavipes]
MGILSPVLYRAPSVRINLIVCLIELCTSSNSVTSLVEARGTITSNVDNSDNLRRSLRLRGLSPDLLKENSRKRTKMPTEQEAKPAVVTPSLQQWRSPSTFRGAPGEDPLKWLKEYDRVANFNKWDDMMCLANVYFFDGTARQWYVNNEDALDSQREFKNGLRRISALLTREINDTASFIKWCNYIEDMKQKRVGRPRFERLPNVVPVASLTDETDLSLLFRTIVREEVHRLVNQTQESFGPDPNP